MRRLRLMSWLFGILLIPLLVTLIWAVMSLPNEPVGLHDLVSENLEGSGATNPVTAVLLNFRAYDTFLEIAVLLLALLGVWSLRGAPPKRIREPAGRVLVAVSRFLVPVMVLIAGYILWAGTSLPGGAFQAGAVLGAAGILLMLADLPVVLRAQGAALRVVLVGAIFVFVGVGFGVMAVGGAFLEYPLGTAGTFILIIEAAGAVSIGAILAAIFAGSPPGLLRPKERDEQGGPREEAL